MGKRDSCRARIVELVSRPADLEQLMLRDSALPGRRANLELAGAFADVAADEAHQPDLWPLIQRWGALSADEAPTNHPREFLCFAAVQAAGALYAAADGVRRDEILALLRSRASDPRWRTREAVAFGLQRIGELDFAALRRICDDWMRTAAPLELRAVLAALAHPPLLSDPGRVGFALAAADGAMTCFRGLDDEQRAAPDGVALRKGLGFAPSVFAAASPDEGFRWLERWASSEEIVIKKIVASNLRKARLARAFPELVEEVGEVLMDGAVVDSEP
jgi:hypothetical protein